MKSKGTLRTKPNAAARSSKAKSRSSRSYPRKKPTTSKVAAGPAASAAAAAVEKARSLAAKARAWTRRAYSAMPDGAQTAHALEALATAVAALSAVALAFKKGRR